MNTLTIPCPTGQVSDGFHTFDELYDHRNHLFIVLLRMTPAHAWRSRFHHDGTGFPGWFIAGTKISGKDITYHLPENLWDIVGDQPVITLQRAPAWDGHTSTDVIERIRTFLLRRCDP
jgi:hypothetical protein